MKNTDVNNNHSTRFSVSKIGSILILIVGIMLGLSLLRNINTILSANKQISESNKRLVDLEAKNKQLEQEVFEADSPGFKEKLMRDQLGLAKPGDNVLILPDSEILKKLSPIIYLEEEPNLPKPIWEKWRDLFF